MRVLEQVEDCAFHPVEVAREEIQRTIARNAGDFTLERKKDNLVRQARAQKPNIHLPTSASNFHYAVALNYATKIVQLKNFYARLFPSEIRHL